MSLRMWVHPLRLCLWVSIETSMSLVACSSIECIGLSPGNIGFFVVGIQIGICKYTHLKLECDFNLCFYSRKGKKTCSEREFLDSVTTFMCRLLSVKYAPF